ncbi:hypothetical protein WBG99_32900 [Streptomyces sp. TG1A-60]|uniref:hypothetical protein n=1 Tax=Streptomyces sp. TG1A-60 TaxID=3129111 RepID=UPI0030CC604F
MTSIEAVRPALSQRTAARVREALTKGVVCGRLAFGADDCRPACGTPRGRGVECAEEPTEHPYGIDRGPRDPFGSGIRFTLSKG